MQPFDPLTAGATPRDLHRTPLAPAGIVPGATPRMPAAARPRANLAKTLDNRGAKSHCAALLMETMPRVMRAMRLIMAHGDGPTLTVPQFRTLFYVESHAGASLSATADFLGLTLPSASKQVDHLVKRGLLVRHHHADDRRRMTLRLTSRGNALLKGAQDHIREQLAGMLVAFDDSEFRVLERALELLQECFPPLYAEAPPPSPLSWSSASGAHHPSNGNGS